MGPGDPRPEDPKNKLRDAVHLIIDRSCTKDDITYEIEEFPGAVPTGPKKYQATVKIALWDGIQGFAGVVGDSKPIAKRNAAEEALNRLKDLLPPLEAAKAEKRRVRDAEREAKKAANNAETEN